MEKAITRRRFGWTLAAGAAGVEAGGAATQDQLPEIDAPPPFPTEDVSELRLNDPETPNAAVELRVAVKRLEEQDLKIVPAKTEDQNPTYYWKGRNISKFGFWAPGYTMITRFDLSWDGKRIPIEERFWNDLPRMSLTRIVLPKRELSDEEQLTYSLQRREMRSPWLKVSAHGGTVLITWPRGEE